MNSAGGRVPFKSNPDRFAPLRISGQAAATIEAWTTQLLADEISLAALPLSLFNLYQAGVRDGRAQREPEIAQAKHEADRLWLLTFAPKDRQEFLLARLDRAAEIAAESGADDVLAEAYRLYCESLDNVREAVAS